MMDLLLKSKESILLISTLAAGRHSLLGIKKISILEQSIIFILENQSRLNFFILLSYSSNKKMLFVSFSDFGIVLPEKIKKNLKRLQRNFSLKTMLNVLSSYGIRQQLLIHIKS